MATLHRNDLPLDPGLVDHVLDRLGLPTRPAADEDGLGSIYEAWCGGVPFDNTRKLLHIAEGGGGPLAGDDVVDFLEAWLRWGTGGTCWAGNGALCRLLVALGFDARRGLGTMMVAPGIPPNHGTVVVRLRGHRFLVDASMLHRRPLLLEEGSVTRVDHAAQGLECRHEDGRFHVRWRPLHVPGGFDCRIESLEVGAAEFAERHEHTRGWSPFNFESNARRNVGDRVVGLAFGNRVEIGADGSVVATPVDEEARRRVLVLEVGISDEVVLRLPPETKTPPPPPGFFTRS